MSEEKQIPERMREDYLRLNRNDETEDYIAQLMEDLGAAELHPIPPGWVLMPITERDEVYRQREEFEAQLAAVTARECPQCHYPVGIDTVTGEQDTPCEYCWLKEQLAAVTKERDEARTGWKQIAELSCGDHDKIVALQAENASLRDALKLIRRGTHLQWYQIVEIIDAALKDRP